MANLALAAAADAGARGETAAPTAGEEPPPAAVFLPRTPVVRPIVALASPPLVRTEEREEEPFFCCGCWKDRGIRVVTIIASRTIRAPKTKGGPGIRGTPGCPGIL